MTHGAQMIARPGVWVASAAAAAGRSRGAGEQDGAHRMGGDAAPEGIPAQGCGGLVRPRPRAGACERVMTRDGTVGRSNATEGSLPLPSYSEITVVGYSPLPTLSECRHSGLAISG